MGAQEDMRGVRQLPFGNLELPWWKMPWLKVADADGSFEKKGLVDLDPQGGGIDTVEIALGNLDRLYLVLETVDVEPLNPFTIRNGQVQTELGRRPLNRWGQFDLTVSPGPQWEAEFALDQLLVVPPGKNWRLLLSNLSPLGRAQYEVRIKGWLSRRSN